MVFMTAFQKVKSNPAFVGITGCNLPKITKFLGIYLSGVHSTQRWTVITGHEITRSQRRQRWKHIGKLIRKNQKLKVYRFFLLVQASLTDSRTLFTCLSEINFWHRITFCYCQ